MRPRNYEYQTAYVQETHGAIRKAILRGYFWRVWQEGHQYGWTMRRGAGVVRQYCFWDAVNSNNFFTCARGGLCKVLDMAGHLHFTNSDYEVNEVLSALADRRIVVDPADFAAFFYSEDYSEIWGIEGRVPYNWKTATRII